MAERDGRDFRQEFSEYWRKTWKSVRIPSRETVFDYYLSTETNTLEPFKNSSWFYTVEYDSTETNMQSVTVPTPETASIAHWIEKLGPGALISIHLCISMRSCRVIAL